MKVSTVDTCKACGMPIEESRGDAELCSWCSDHECIHCGKVCYPSEYHEDVGLCTGCEKEEERLIYLEQQEENANAAFDDDLLF